MAIEKTIIIDVDQKQATAKINKLTQDVNKLEKTTEQTTKKSSGGFSKMSDSVGKLSPTLGRAQEGMKGVLFQMKAILKNPLALVLVAIVGALTLLFKAFTSTKAGAEKLEQVMSGLSAVVDVVRDRILNVGNAIVKFFSGDFKGAISEGKKAVSGFGDEVSKEFKVAANAAKQLQQVSDAMRSLGESRAKLDRDLAKSKQLLTDENATYEEKKKAIEQIRISEAKQTAQELANAQKKLNAIIKLNKQSDTSKKDLEKESEARIALYNLQQKSAEDLRNIQKQEKTLANEEEARLKSIEDQRKQDAKERQDKAKESKAAEIALAKEVKDKEIALAKERADALERIRQGEIDTESERRFEELKKIQDQYTQLISEAEKYGLDTLQLKEAQRTKEKEVQDKFDLEDKAKEDKKRKEDLDYWSAEADRAIADSLKKKQDAENEKQLEREVLNAKIGFAQQGLSLIQEVAGKGSKIGKAAAIAQTVITGIQGVQNAYSTAQKSPITALFPAYPILQAGIAGAFSALQLAKMKSSSAGGGGGSSVPSAPSISASATAPQFNVVGNTGINQIAQTLGSQQPVQAYVVAGNVTTAQSLNRNIINNATLG